MDGFLLNPALVSPDFNETCAGIPAFDISSHTSTKDIQSNCLAIVGDDWQSDCGKFNETSFTGEFSAYG